MGRALCGDDSVRASLLRGARKSWPRPGKHRQVPRRHEGD